MLKNPLISLKKKEREIMREKILIISLKLESVKIMWNTSLYTDIVKSYRTKG